MSAKGLGSGRVVDEVTKALLAEVEDKVGDACELVQTELDALCTRTGDLQTQLQSLDKGAAAWLVSAEFLPEGMVLRGRIALAARKALVVQSEPLADENGYTALQSWIPGGRIDSFEWSWTWAGTAPPASQHCSAVYPFSSAVGSLCTTRALRAASAMLPRSTIP